MKFNYVSAMHTTGTYSQCCNCYRTRLL